MFYSKIDPLYAPRRVIYAHAMVRDEDGYVLQATDSPVADDNAWHLLVQAVEPNQAPHEIARSVAESQTGLTIGTSTLLVLDLVRPTKESAQALHLVFDCGRCTEDQVLELGLPEGTEREGNMRWVHPDTLRRGDDRLHAALERLTDPFAPFFLADGQPTT
ncbi:hypothetical protein [Kitasatospora sp. NPDC094016]|uniref:hypothetical protein n=1 Tax=Kitasatospora sp. NPDC094016 TaxID=3154986 RepID=UPI00332D489B